MVNDVGAAALLSGPAALVASFVEALVEALIEELLGAPSKALLGIFFGEFDFVFGVFGVLGFITGNYTLLRRLK